MPTSNTAKRPNHPYGTDSKEDDGPGKAAREVGGARTAQADHGAQSAAGRRGQGDDRLGVTGQNS